MTSTTRIFTAPSLITILLMLFFVFNCQAFECQDRLHAGPARQLPGITGAGGYRDSHFPAANHRKHHSTPWCAKRPCRYFRHLALFNLDLIELKVQGNAETSRVVGKRPAQLKLPKRDTSPLRNPRCRRRYWWGTVGNLSDSCRSRCSGRGRRPRSLHH